ncbi:hypothetical protein BC567DRAFT_237714 [Phyllosticta citribraziliensis]
MSSSPISAPQPNPTPLPSTNISPSPAHPTTTLFSSPMFPASLPHAVPHPSARPRPITSHTKQTKT